MTHGPISIIETRWWPDGNHSIRPIFEAVAGVHFNNPSSFYYDMFSNRSSLNNILHVRCSDEQTKVIYLATHGDDNNIGQTADLAISRTEFRNDLISANKKKQVSGLYLGTCYTGNADTARFLLSDGKANLGWVAGYTESVDWVDGSAIDMVFFHKLTEQHVKNKSRKKKLSAQEMAKIAATELNKLIPGSHSKYGFNIFFCEGKKVTSMFDGG